MIGWVRRRREERERAEISASVSHSGEQYIGQVVELQDHTGRKFFARVIGAPSSTVLTIATIGRWSVFWWRARRAVRRLFSRRRRWRTS